MIRYAHNIIYDLHLLPSDTPTTITNATDHPQSIRKHPTTTTATPRYLLVASGPELLIYRYPTPTFVGWSRIFATERIHCVESALIDATEVSVSYLVVISAGIHLRICMLEFFYSDAQSQSQSLRCTIIHKFPSFNDRILTIRIVSNGCCCSPTLNPAQSQSQPSTPSQYTIAIGFAHNSVSLIAFRLRSANPSQSNESSAHHIDVLSSQTFQCLKRSLLYSFNFSGECLHQLRAIGGTVFSKLLIWRLFDGSRNANLNDDTVARPVEVELEGHQGVIFWVSSSPCSSIILSCSDDRTIRQWKRTSLEDEPLQYELKSVSFGHTARVWRCLLPSLSNPVFISGGEDGATIIWNPETGEPLRKILSSNGGIWSIVYDRDLGNIIVGAKDGSVRFYKWSSPANTLSPPISQPPSASPTSNPLLEAPAPLSNTSTIKLDLHHLLTTFQDKIPGEYIRTLSLLKTSDQIITVFFTTDSNCVFKVNPFKMNPSSSLELLYQASDSEKQKSFVSTMEVITRLNQPLLLCADTKGSIRLLSGIGSFQPITFPNVHTASVVGIYVWPEQLSPINTVRFVSSDAIGSVILWEVDISTSSISPTFRQCGRMRLSSKASISSFLVIRPVSPLDLSARVDAHGFPEEQIILCGDNRGSIFVYLLVVLPLPDSTTRSQDDKGPRYLFIAQHRVINIHYDSPVTALQYLPELSQLYSLGKDGTLQEFTLQFSLQEEPDLWLDAHNQSQMEVIQNICNNSGAAIKPPGHFRLNSLRMASRNHLSTPNYLLDISPPNSDSNHFIIAGFSSTDFLIYDYTKHCNVLQIPCGGGRRPNAFVMSSLQNWHFVYSKHDKTSSYLFIVSSPNFRDTHEPNNNLEQNTIETFVPKSQSIVPSAEFEMIGTPFHTKLTSSIHFLLPSNNLSSVTVLPELVNTNSEIVFITGSEDRSIKIWSLLTPSLDASPDSNVNGNPDLSSLSLISTLSDHPDIVRTICTHWLTPTSSLIFSGGGRSYLHVSSISLSPRTVAKSSSSRTSCTIQSLTGIGGHNTLVGAKPWLRPEDMSKSRLDKIDVRILAIAVLDLSTLLPDVSTNQYFLVYVSDSMCNLHFYLFALSTATFYDLHALETSSPVLTLTSMDVDNTFPILISTQTDGNVHVYSIEPWLRDLVAVCKDPSIIPSIQPRSRPKRVSKTGIKRKKHESFPSSPVARELEVAANHAQPKYSLIPACILKFKPHQNGVNCADALYVNRQLIVATGGDDQQIVVTRIHLDALRQTSASNFSQFVISHAHRSAVKTLKMSKYLSDDSTNVGSFRLFSSGYDQQLGHFKLKCSGDQITVIQRSTTSLQCEDISTIDIINPSAANYHILVAGRGFEYVRAHVM